MDKKFKESKSAATIRRRTHRNNALTSFLNWRHKLSGYYQNNHESDEDGACASQTSEDFLASSKLIRTVMSSQKTLLLALMSFRILNALLIQTSYVPDEYWQSTEVAHRMAFGYGYLTWEWQNGLRGYLYPTSFAVVYKLLAFLHMDSRTFIVKIPRMMHGIFAAVGDLYVYRLSHRLSGPGVAFWTLLCQLTSWFQFYTLPRTLSNSMEAILTAVALYYFPWPSKSRKSQWKYVSVVAVAIIIRPTAAITWFPLCAWHAYMSRHSLPILLKECAVRGLLVFLLSSVLDYIFYGKWVNVYYNFLEFNFLSDLGSFYGSHPWHWYLSQGLVVVLATHILPLVMAIRKGIEPVFVGLILWSVTVYSMLSHKEFRFMLGIFPLIMHVCGSALHRFLHVPAEEADDGKHTKDKPTPRRTNTSLKSAVLICLIAVNLPIALYTCLIHQRGTVDVTTFLYKEAQKPANDKMSVLFLMPCHSTPYYSYIHRNVSMRFLTCEPNLSRQANYTDEADVFYRSPGDWLTRNYFGDNATETLPSHIVLFDQLFIMMPSLMNNHRSDYDQCARFFHTHFPEGRVSTYVIVMCSAQWTQRSVPHQFQQPVLNSSSSSGSGSRRRGIGR